MSVKYFDEFGNFCQSLRIKYVEFGTLKGGDEWQFKSLKAPYNRLYIILDGEGGVISNDKEEIHLKPGNAYFIPAGYDFDTASPIFLEKIFIHFMVERDYSEDIFGQVVDVLECPIHVKDFRNFSEGLETESKNLYYKMKQKCDGLIFDFIDMAINQNDYDMNINQEKLMTQISDLVRRHLSAELKVSWIAKNLGMTNAALSRYYRSKAGTTLKEVILDKLIQKAQVMLLTEDLTISEVAEHLGYADHLYFSKVFSKRTGMSPTTYRKHNGYTRRKR